MKKSEFLLFLEENGFAENKKKIKLDDSHMIYINFIEKFNYLKIRKWKLGIHPVDVFLTSSIFVENKYEKQEGIFFNECVKLINSIDMILDKVHYFMRLEFYFQNGFFIYQDHIKKMSYVLHFDETKEYYNSELGFAFYSCAITKNEA